MQRCPTQVPYIGWLPLPQRSPGLQGIASDYQSRAVKQATRCFKFVFEAYGVISTSSGAQFRPKFARFAQKLRRRAPVGAAAQIRNASAHFSARLSNQYPRNLRMLAASHGGLLRRQKFHLASADAAASQRPSRPTGRRRFYCSPGSSQGLT